MIGIPEVSTLLLDTVASDREATKGRNKALEAKGLAQNNILRESVGINRSAILQAHVIAKASEPSC